MMKAMTLVIMMLSVGLLSACGGGGDREDMKSPCVGIEGSPCGDRRHVNEWWLT
jgi:hypothetical protein